MMFLQESYTDASAKPGKAQIRGVCVECINSFDCQVNQYCGVGDIKIEKLTSSNVGTAGAFCTRDS